ncbi:MAG: GPW/gp25 family protein [Candidatus Thorarchaeota archaeon]
MSSNHNNHLSFPFRIGRNGRTAQVKSLEELIRDEIIQLLLTNPGERLFLPQFGAGTRQLVYSNIDDFSLAKGKSIITQAFSKWLGDRIEIENLKVEVVNDKINVKIDYHIIGSNKPHTISYQNLE